MRWRLKSKASDKISEIELISREGNEFKFRVNSKEILISYSGDRPSSFLEETKSKDEWRITGPSDLYLLEIVKSSAKASSQMSEIKSQMPGRVFKVFVKPGDKVEQGTPLFVLEAMKMENEIRSPRSGIIAEVSVNIGQSVESRQLLLKFET